MSNRAKARVKNETENEIFEEYALRFYPRGLVRDGALGQAATAFYEQTRRVLFVLREANDPHGTWPLSDLRSQGEGSCHGRKSTWPNLARWTALATSGNFAMSFEQAKQVVQDDRYGVLRKTAVVNLKKIAGGSTANDSLVSNEVRRTSNLFKQQLALYKPHVTIAASDFVAEELARLYNVPTPLARLPAKEALAHFHSDELGHVIASWHPAARVRNQTVYEALQSSLQHLFRESSALG